MKIQNQLIILNIIGGIFVLGGYIFALINNPSNRSELWGGVAENFRPWIISSMFLSAFGYCYAMKYLLIDDVIPFKFFFNRFETNFILIVQFIFLFSAALWIHTTFSYLNSPTSFKWTLINLELWTTGVSILCLALGIIFIKDRPYEINYIVSVLGLLAISFHCIFLDAFLWVNKFPKLH